MLLLFSVYKWEWVSEKWCFISDLPLESGFEHRTHLIHCFFCYAVTATSIVTLLLMTSTWQILQWWNDTCLLQLPVFYSYSCLFHIYTEHCLQAIFVSGASEIAILSLMLTPFSKLLFSPLRPWWQLRCI